MSTETRPAAPAPLTWKKVRRGALKTECGEYRAEKRFGVWNLLWTPNDGGSEQLVHPAHKTLKAVKKAAEPRPTPGCLSR